MIPTRAQVKSLFLGLLDDEASGGAVFLKHAGGPQYFVSGGSVAGSPSTVTLTIGLHSINTGDLITVSGITSTSGNLNDPEVGVSAVSATTISYQVPGSPVYVSGGTVSTGNSSFDTGFQMAYDAIFQALLIGQCPRIKNIVIYTLAPQVLSLTPAVAGITDFGDYIQIRERLTGSSEFFRRLESREELTQRSMTDRLLEFVWREDTFFFVGSTTQRDLEITYFSSATAPTIDSTSIGLDGCLSFLANYAAGIAGPRKGADETGQRCMSFAVGPKYDQGTIGGELFRIIQDRVRSEQKTQIAPRPFTSFRRGLPLWRAPYIAAQQPQGSGTAPAQFTTSDGTITGTIDGVNTQFILAFPVSTANAYRNGVLQTRGLDFFASANLLTFTTAPIPGDVITVEGWV